MRACGGLCAGCSRDRLKLVLLLQKRHHFRQMLQGEHAHPSGDGRLGPVFGRHHQIAQSHLARGHGDRQGAPHRPQRAIERKLANE